MSLSSFWRLLLGLTFAGGLLVPLAWADEKEIPISGEAEPALASFDQMMVKFLRDHKVPGATLAIARHGQLIYERGFGEADPEKHSLMKPRSRFRIASISKPITAAAILKLVEEGKLDLDASILTLLDLKAVAGAESDVRLEKITVRMLLRHTAGWDRNKTYDPMFNTIEIAEKLKIAPPARSREVIRFMLGQRLDFDPGERYAYSNLGYCILGRIVEKASGQGYEAYVRDHVLTPLGMKGTQVGKTLKQATDEVHYSDEKGRTGKAIHPEIYGKNVPWPYGSWILEDMDAFGGWISTAPDLVRFASAFDPKDGGSLLNKESLKAMFARPEGLPGHDKEGKAKKAYYGLGWQVRVVTDEGGFNYWHTGGFSGTSTLLVHRQDGLCWAALFNTRASVRDRKDLAGLVDPLLHEASTQVKAWPKR